MSKKIRNLELKHVSLCCCATCGTSKQNKRLTDQLKRAMDLLEKKKGICQYCGEFSATEYDKLRKEVKG